MTSTDTPSADPSSETGEIAPGKAGSARRAGNGEGIKTQVSDFARSAKDQAASAVKPIAENAKSIAEDQKQRGAGKIDSLAQAIHGAAERLGGEAPGAANYVHATADRLDRASRMLRENSVDDLFDKAVQLARERPLLFAGASVAIGFALARFLRSTQDRPRPDEDVYA